MIKKIIYKKILNFWEKDFSFLKKRNHKINFDFNSKKAVTIIWPRRSWKTFTCYQLALELQEKWIDKKNIIYFNLEDEKLEKFSSQDLNLILEVYFENFLEKKIKNKNWEEKIFLFLDEIQEISWWEKFVRRILDEEEDILLVLTWSSSKMLSTEIATNLRWRTLTYEVLPLSFSEVLKFNWFNFDKKYFSDLEEIKYKKFFSDVLKFWSFPEIILENSDEIKINILKNYYDVIFYRDVVERWWIKQIAKAKEFRRFLTNSNTRFFTFSEIAKNVWIDENTVKNWNNFFIDSFYVRNLKKFDFSLKAQERSKKKNYLIDNWFYNWIFWYQFENNWINFENIIFLEFLKKWFKENEDLFYFNIDWYEIDFLIIENWKIVPIQVSYDVLDEKTLKRELRSLEKILEKYPEIEKCFLIIPFLDNEKYFEFNKKNEKIEIIDFKKYFL